MCIVYNGRTKISDLKGEHTRRCAFVCVLTCYVYVCVTRYTQSETDRHKTMHPHSIHIRLCGV